MASSGPDGRPAVAVLGLGIMGGRIAARLIDAGVAVAVWNRDPAKARRSSSAGAAVASDPVAAVAGSAVVVMMLADGPASEEVLWTSGVAEALAPGTIVVDMASIPAPSARSTRAGSQSAGVAYLDAPVSGGARGAEDGHAHDHGRRRRGGLRGGAGLFDPLGRSTESARRAPARWPRPPTS